MAKTNGLKALFFDIFGTCVDWRKTVTEALIDAAKQAGDTKMVLHENTILKNVVADHVHSPPTTGPLSPKNGAHHT